MDADKIKGKMKDAKGRIERQAGEWTGNEELQARGTADQASGKAQNLKGNIEDAGREALDKTKQAGREVQRPRRTDRHVDGVLGRRAKVGAR